MELFFAKAVLNPKKDVKRFEIKDNPNPQQSKIGRQASKKEYLKNAEELVKFVEKNKRLPNYVEYKGFKLSPKLLTYTFSKILTKYDKNWKFQSEVTLANKVFSKTLETSNKVYEYFIKVFNKGKKVKIIDDALILVKETVYSSYYDDHKSNKETIDSMKSNKHSDDPNCTDSCHVFMNIGLQLFAWGIYKKVECIHVQCSSGGHVKHRFTQKDGTKFYCDLLVLFQRTVNH